MSSRRRKAMVGTDVVVLGAEEGGVIGGPGSQGLADWLRRQDAMGGRRQMWVGEKANPTRPLAEAVGTAVRHRSEVGDKTPMVEAPGPVATETTAAFLRSEMAERLGIRRLHDEVHGLDRCFFAAVPDYSQVAPLCRGILEAAAEVVVRLHPRELGGIETGSPLMTVHILDAFFASRLGEDLEEPGRKLVRNALVLSCEILARGTPGRHQAAVCMEAVRFLVANLLVLI